MARKRLLAIANPISGRGRARKLAPRLAKLARAAGVEIDLRVTEAAGHARQLAAQAVPQGFDAVICCGGDGTLNEVVNGIGAGGPPVMLVAAGTGNVLAKEIGASANPMQYLRTLREWRLVQRDLGRTGFGRLFTCFVGAGFDGECTRELGRIRKGSIWIWQYAPIILGAISRSRFSTLRLEVDGRPERENASFLLCAITPFYGGPIQLCERADPSDGALDFISVTEPIHLCSVLRFLALGLIRRVRWARSVRHTRGSRAGLTAGEPGGRPVAVQIDGDFAGELPVSVETVPRGLTLLAP